MKCITTNPFSCSTYNGFKHHCLYAVICCYKRDKQRPIFACFSERCICNLLCTTVTTYDFLPPEGCSDESLNHLCDYLNQQQRRHNLNSSGGVEHYAWEEVAVVSNTWASRLKYLSKLWWKKCVVLFPLQVTSEDDERSSISTRKE